MKPLNTIETEYKGYTIKVHVHHDEHMGAPWEEHDGHGVVSEWEYRDKQPGERVLSEDGRCKRFYDWPATMKKAKAEGWGLSEKDKAKLAAHLGREPRPGDILHAAVEHDFQFLRGWCNDEWHWIGYVTEIIQPDGTVLENSHDSCWGYEGTDEGQEYMVGEAQGAAKSTIDRHLSDAAKESAESQEMACRDIVTV